MKCENKNSRNFPVCRLQSMTEHPPVAGIGRYDIDKAWEKSMTSTSMKFCWSKVNVCSRHIPAVECGQLLWNVSYQHMLFYITGIITTLHLPEQFIICGAESFVEVFCEFRGTRVFFPEFVCNLIIWTASRIFCVSVILFCSVWVFCTAT